MPEHTKTARPIFLATIIGVFLLCVALAVIAFGKDAAGDTQFTFFGQNFRSTHVGIAAVFIAGVVVVLTIRRVFKSLDHAVTRESVGAGHDSEHTRLLAEQVKAQKEAHEYQRQKDLRETQPCFVWRDGSQTNEKMVCNFQNTGGRIKITGWSRRPPGSEMNVVPDPWIEHDQLGFVVFERSEGLHSYYEFEIRYVTDLGIEGSKKFYVEARNGIPEEK
jgi:hypothetical protein